MMEFALVLVTVATIGVAVFWFRCMLIAEKDAEKDPVPKIDFSNVADPNAVLKMLEIEWQDHFQTRQQTWEALKVAALLTVALVGVQWSAGTAIVGVLAAALVIGISLLGMQITLRHRNSTEVNKFTIIGAIEKKLGMAAEDLPAPDCISLHDLFTLKQSNTSLFLLRMQGLIHLAGWLMLLLWAWKGFTD